MAVIFIEGFDYPGSITQLLARWTNSVGLSELSLVDGPLGTGFGKALQITRASAQGNLFQGLLWANTQEVIVSFDFRTNSLSNSDKSIIYLTDNVDISVALTYDTSGRVNVHRGSGEGTIVAQSATSLIVVDTWYHLEWRIKVTSGTSGSTRVLLNGTEIINATGLNTQVGANAYTNGVMFFGANMAGTGATKAWDNLVVNDTTGEPDDVIGLSRVLTLFPDADGALDGEWAVSSGSDAFAMVDDATADGDSTYIQAEANTDAQTFLLPNITGVDIIAYGIIAQVKKTAATDRKFRLTVRPDDGIDYDGAQTTPVNGTYKYYEHIWSLDPDTGVAWTRATVVDSQPGIRVDTAVSPAGTDFVRCTQFAVQLVVAESPVVPGGGSTQVIIV